MSRFIAPQHLATAHLVLSGLVLVWNLYIGGRTAQLRATPRPMAVLSGLAALLLVPTLIVLLVSSSLLSGRALASISWVWPLTVTLVAAQAIYAVVRGFTAPPIGISIAAYNVLLALTASAQYAMSAGVSIGTPLIALVAAQRGALAFSAQPFALLKPWYLYLPIFAPSTPGRPGIGTVLRTALATLAAAWGALIIIDVPIAIRAVMSYARYADVRLQERPDSDFAIGVKVLPTLTTEPSPLSLQSDLSLVDSIGAEVLSVYVTPRGATSAVLDSVAHSLEEARGDKPLIAVLDFSNEAPLAPAARARYLRARLADVEHIIRQLKPEYLVPVRDPTGSATRAIGPISVSLWTSFLQDASTIAHRVDPKIRVLAHIGGFSPQDSALYAWAASPGSPVDGIGLSLLPWLGGAETLDARLHTADSWLRSTRTAKEHWVLEAGGFPLSHGESSQARAIWGALAWATSRSIVKGLIVYEASDYGIPIGLRVPGGRLRKAATTVIRAVHTLGE